MQSPPTFVLPRPGRAVLAALIATSALWVLTSVALNWLRVGEGVVAALIGSSSGVLHGQLWRLVTAPLLHDPRSPGHLLTTLLGLYFLAPALEERWGARRMGLFFVGAGALAFTLQVLGGLIFRPLAQEAWFGGLGVVEAVAVAWALGARGQSVRLFFAVPVSARGLLLFILAMSVLNVIALHAPAEGLLTPFGGMLAGYLLGDGSPLRRLLLRRRARVLRDEAAAMGGRRRRPGAPSLEVLPGGKGASRDKRWLN